MSIAAQNDDAQISANELLEMEKLLGTLLQAASTEEQVAILKIHKRLQVIFAKQKTNQKTVDYLVGLTAASKGQTFQ